MYLDLMLYIQLINKHTRSNGTEEWFGLLLFIMIYDNNKNPEFPQGDQ